MSFFILFGWPFLAHIRESFGPWVYGIAIAAVVCAAALPLCYVGVQLRVLWNARRDGENRDLPRNIMLTAWDGPGTTVLLIAVVALESPSTFARATGLRRWVPVAKPMYCVLSHR
jgi:hypothetical protein